MAGEDVYDQLDRQLNSHEVPLAQRFRALFTLKSLGGDRAIEVIGKGFDGESALLGHELAYCLGQLKDPKALPILTKVLEDDKEHPMVRHEAAEAMGAIGSEEALPALRKYLKHENPAIRETCEIAVDKIVFDNSEEGKKAEPNQYPCIDPAPAASHSPLVASAHSAALAPATDLSIPDLERILLDTKLSLFERYRAMFALRNIGDREAVLALAKGFEDESALFRHEIAFVFGQLSSPDSVPSLIDVLRRPHEEDMVRHEAAEALGGIATDECLPILKEFAQREDVPRVVRESCVVALDMYEYERSNEFVPLPTLPTATASA
ncbi:Deoxyhypusine hydroxylase [Rhodotorula toruloides]|uniref:Deoxyhypusine hydroxylase n=1 Tax=Rhodotorula toruloides TaxID=5286 RepID=A0A0K3C5X8_RHOTO|nr:Deoxyhypusine hydroxylase [Rhodotorula toruloides]PRQ77416.1 Armadillo-type fold [Rhodotorula toruloides]